MSFLLDTNAISEVSFERPDAGFMKWFEGADENGFNLSTLTIGELRYGALKYGWGAKRRGLDEFIAQVIEFYGDRILPFDLMVAEAWASLRPSLKDKGRAIGAVDELIAATAIAHDLTVVTRNVRHFEPTGCKWLSPWSARDDV